jgi:hypothetical protein
MEQVIAFLLLERDHWHSTHTKKPLDLNPRHWALGIAGNRWHHAARSHLIRWLQMFLTTTPGELVTDESSAPDLIPTS